MTSLHCIRRGTASFLPDGSDVLTKGAATAHAAIDRGTTAIAPAKVPKTGNGKNDRNTTSRNKQTTRADRNRNDGPTPNDTSQKLAPRSRFFHFFFQVVRRFRMFLKVFGRVRMCSDAFGRVRMRWDAIGCIWVRWDALGRFVFFFEKFCNCIRHFCNFLDVIELGALLLWVLTT